LAWLRQRSRWLAGVAAEATAVVEVAWAEAMAAALVVAVSMAAAASAVAASHSMMEVSAAANFVVVDSANFVVVESMIAISGAAASASATPIMTTMTTMLTTIRTAIIRLPPAIHMRTTAVAMWSSDACTLRMAGACNPVRCAVDGLS